MRLVGTFVFSLLAVFLLATTVAAGLQQDMFAAGARLWPSLWFRATLLDVYVGLAVSFAWIAWKENTAARRVLWLAIVLGTGNIGVAAYAAWQFHRLRPGEGITVLLTRRAA